MNSIYLKNSGKFKIKIGLLMALAFFGNQTSAQQTFSIKGKVLSSDHKVIEFGNAIALSISDSSIIKGAPFENGQFIIPGVGKDSLILKITSLGYTSLYATFFRPANDSVVNVGELILQTDNALKEVTVSAKVQLFEMDGEKMKVNVEQTSLSSVGTALDVLRRSPGVSVNSTDNVTILGKGPPIIYLDGLQIASTDILKSIPSNDIKSIEIINNPSAKYDAGGRAVINIITIKNNRQGYNGNVIQNTLYIKNIFTYTGLRFNYNQKKWSISLGYGTSNGQQWNSDEYKRSYKTNDSTNIEMNNSIYETQISSNVYYYRAGVNYRPDSLSTIGIQYNGFYVARKDASENNNTIDQNNTEAYVLHTKTATSPLQVNHNINANYSKKLDTLGSELFAAAQYGSFDIKNVSPINQETRFNSITAYEEKRNTNQNNVNIISAQVDWTKAFNKRWKLESGIKEANIRKISDIKFENYSLSNEWISDPAYRNGFNFTENIAALYSELRFKKNKLNARIGGRAELTNTDGFSKRTNQTIIQRQYLNFFPSGYVGYDFTKDLTTSLTVSSRINRPTFQDLDPFINYIDSLSSFRGNPYLLPEYTNSVEAALIYMKEASITFNYSRTDGAMKLVVDKLQDGSDAFIASTKNLNKSETYSFGVVIPYELKWWTTANYFGYFINKFSYSQGGIIVNNNRPTFNINLYDEFRFKTYFSLELEYQYTSSAVDGIFISNPFSMLSVTLKKNLFKDKLTCRFMASDILSTTSMSGQSNIPVYNVSYRSRYGSHFYLLALNYKFGKLKDANYKNRSVSDDEFNRVKTGK